MPEHCQENNPVHDIKKEIAPLFYHQKENINIYLFNNLELDIVCTVFIYEKEVRSAK